MKKRRIIFFSVLIIIIVLIILAVVNKEPEVEYTTAQAVRGKLIQTVIETGTVKPIQEFNLNFMSSGKLAEVMVKIGDQVEQGTVLAKLDQTDLLIRQQEATAALNVAQANLDKLIAGASNTAVAVSSASASQAKSAYDAAIKDLEKTKQTTAESLAQAQKNLSDLTSIAPGTETPEEITLINTKKTYQKSVDNKTETLAITIENKLAVATSALDAVDRIISDSDIDDYLGAQDKNSVINTELTYNDGKNLLTTAKADYTAVKAGTLTINSSYSSTMNAINKIFASLNYCFSALENSTTATVLTQSELDTFKSGISTQITYITTAISALQTAKQNLDDAVLTYDTQVLSAEISLSDAITTAEQTLATTKVTNAQTLSTAESKVETTKRAWEVASAQLTDLTTTARTEDISLARAQVRQAQAQLDLTLNNIEQNTIKAPVEGVVTKIEFEIGEQTAPTQTIITMLADHEFILELDISETDISKLRLGNQASVTLDAYGEDIIFPGEVIFIEPAETEIQGVVYYKVDIDFDPGDYEIKSGMTASADIITAEKEDILMIPIRAILEREQQKVVRIMFGKKSVQEMPVEIGIMGDEGMVEVLAGVEDGDEVVTYVKNNGK